MNVEPNLKKALSEALLISPDGLSEHDLLRLIKFEAHYKFIENIQGLELATNLEDLDLSGNRIRDGSPLQSLIKLKKLDLHWCNLEKIDFLSNLINIQWLNLRDNSIFSIKSLENLTNLHHLFLSENIIIDLSPLRNLSKLETLHLGTYTDNPIGSLTAEMYGNPYWEQISNIEPLSNLTCLNELFLQDHNLQDIEPLAKLKNLKTLYLDGNYNTKKLKDIAALESLYNLKTINLENNAIEDLDPLIKNKKLGEYTEIYLKNNPLSDSAKKNQIPKLRKRGVKIFLR